MAKRLCAVLGASGIVSQRLQQRLVNHPWFELAAVCGGPDTAGKALHTIDWKLEQKRPDMPDLTALDLAYRAFFVLVSSQYLSLIHTSHPTRPSYLSSAVFCLI